MRIPVWKLLAEAHRPKGEARKQLGTLVQGLLGD